MLVAELKLSHQTCDWLPLPPQPLRQVEGVEACHIHQPAPSLSYTLGYNTAIYVGSAKIHMYDQFPHVHALAGDQPGRILVPPELSETLASATHYSATYNTATRVQLSTCIISPTFTQVTSLGSFAGDQPGRWSQLHTQLLFARMGFVQPYCQLPTRALSMHPCARRSPAWAPSPPG